MIRFSSQSHNYWDMKITVKQLRRLIRESIRKASIDEEDMGQGHEPSTRIYQMNHQGDGDHYDQMGKLMDEEDPDEDSDE